MHGGNAAVINAAPISSAQYVLPCSGFLFFITVSMSTMRVGENHRKNINQNGAHHRLPGTVIPAAADC